MLLVTGEVERIATREAGIAPNTWIEQSIVVQDWGQTLFVKVARDFGALPAEGERVALDCVVGAYVTKSTGKAGFELKALRRRSDVEKQLFPSRSAASPVSSVS